MMIMAVIKAAIVTGCCIISDFIHILSILVLLATRFIRDLSAMVSCGPFLIPLALLNLLNVNVMNDLCK